MRNFATKGEVNNRLTLIECVEKRLGAYIWSASCECGNITRVSVQDFRSGHTKSCGCFKKQALSELRTTHGRTDSSEYRSWSHMLGRCNNPTDSKYPDYGGRGIKVCDRWSSFDNSYLDLGPKPTIDHSLDRMDNDADYSPTNCRWATRFQQAQNKRNNVHVFIGGQQFVLAEACRLLGIDKSSLHQRARSFGGTLQDAADHFARKKRIA